MQTEPTKVKELTTALSMQAIHDWQFAWARLISYAWENWEDNDILRKIIEEPHEHLKMFGFNPDDYNVSMAFLIDKKDFAANYLVTYDRNATNVSFSKKVINEVLKFLRHKEGKGEEKDSASIIEKTLIETLKIFMEHSYILQVDQYPAYQPSTENPRENGWKIKPCDKLLALVSQIPPKPIGENENDQSLMAITDFMDISNANPFTCT